MSLTIGTHNLHKGQPIKLATKSLVWTCALDGDATEHNYPRATIDTHQAASGSTYVATTGVLDVTTTAAHGIKVGDWIKFDEGAITFSCTMDGGSANKAYPRKSDPTYGKWLQVESIPSTTRFTVNVGTSPQKTYTPTDADYNPTTGIMELTIGTHGMVAGDAIKLAQDSLTFTCDYNNDNHTTTKTYPRSNGNDSATYNTSIEITSVGDAILTPTFALYDPTTGYVTLTVKNHPIKNGDKIKIADNALQFTCEKDNFQTKHTYPRATDEASGKWLSAFNVTNHTFDVQILPVVPSSNVTEHKFTQATANSVSVKDATISMQVLPSAPSTDQTEHRFVSASAGAVITGGNYTHTFVSGVANGIKQKRDKAYDQPVTIKYEGTPFTAAQASTSYDPATGNLTIGSSGHDLVVGDYIKLADESLTFQCTLDSNGSNHLYPRPSDPASDTWLRVDSVDTNDFVVNVGKSPDLSTHTCTATVTNGCVKRDGTITINVGTSSNTSNHTFVRAKAGAIQTGTGEPVEGYSVSGATYTPASGLLELNVGKNNFSIGEMVKIANNSLTFVCDHAGDNYITTKSYPRTTDPIYDTYVEITDLGTSSKTATGATYIPTTGLLTLTVPNHGFESGDEIRIVDQSLVFTCLAGGGTHAYPRSTDPASGKWLTVTVVDSDTFKVNPGTSSNTTTHAFDSAVANGIQYKSGIIKINALQGTSPTNTSTHQFVNANNQYTPTDAEYEPTTGWMKLTLANHGFANGEMVKVADAGLVFTCALDNDRTLHSYPRETDPKSGKWMRIANVTQNTFDINVGISSNETLHTFSDAVFNCLTRAVVYNGGPYVHEFVSAVPHGLLAQNGDITVNVGESPNIGHDVSAATYTATTGDMTLNIGAHNLNVGNTIKINDDSLTFQCNMDSQTTNKTYPRATDPVHDTPIPITAIGETQHSVTAGTHLFVSALSGGIRDADNTGNTYTVSGAVYTAETGNLVVTVAADGTDSLQAADSIQMKVNSLTMTCDLDAHGSNHQYPRLTDPIFTTLGTGTSDSTWSRIIPITKSGNDLTFNVGIGTAGTQYDPTTGLLKLYINGHGFTGTSNLTAASGSTYNPTTGELAVTTSGSHGLANGDKIRFDEGAITFQCSMDSNATNHPYPRKTDPTFGKWLDVTVDSSAIFKVNVGKSPIKAYHVAHAEYDHTSGELELVIGNHNLHAGSSIKIEKESLTFTCSNDGYATEHKYPRTSDPAYDAPLKIIGVTPTSITVDVDVAAGGNQFPHRFVPAPGLTPSAATYDATTGVLQMTITGHGIVSTGKIKIAEEALKFTCDMDHHETVHNYPRKTDPIYEEWLDVTVVDANTISVNVGTTPAVNHDVTNAVYNPNDGTMVLTIGDHSLEKGQGIKIGQDKLTFKCKQDATTQEPDGVTLHTYPRNVIDTETVNTASYDPATGHLQLTVPLHGFSYGDKIQLVDDSLTFRCAKDGNTTDHTYPRSSDPISGKWLPIFDVTSTTFKINVLDSAPSTNPDAHIFQSATNNGVRIQRDPYYDRTIYIDDVTRTTITVNVGISSNVSDHTWAGGTSSNAITSGGNYTHTFYGAVDNGIKTSAVTTGGNYTHVFQSGAANGIKKAGDLIKLDTDSLKFVCKKDDNSTYHTYPRISDPANKQWIPIENVATNTFDVQIGKSPDTSVHTFISAPSNTVKKQTGEITVNVGASPQVLYDVNGATYNFTTGDLVLNIGAHDLLAGQNVKLANESLTFQCTYGGSPQQVAYPRASGSGYVGGTPAGSDYAYNRSLPIASVGEVSKTVEAATYTPNTGILRISILNHGLSDSDKVRILDGTLTFTCSKDNHMTTHAYPRGNDPISNKWMNISNVTDNTFDIDVGTTTIGDFEHIFVSASASGLKVQNGQITLDVKPITSVGAPTAHTFIGATAGALITGGNYTHTFQSASAGAVRTGTGYINKFVSAEENSVTSHGLTQVTDSNIPFIYGGYPRANKRIDELMSIVTDTLLDPNAQRTVEYPNSVKFITRTHPTFSKCVRDAKEWVKAICYDLRNEGNSKSWDTAAYYVDRSDVNNITINHISGEEGETVFAIGKVRDFMINVMRGDAIAITGDHGFTQVIDETITRDSANPYCQNVASAITTYTGIISDTIDQATALDPADHLGTVTRNAPTSETAAGVVDGVVTTEWTADKEFPDDDLFVSNRINPSSQDRFKDAADLIRANATVIVDETAGDMLGRYPDLVQDMPRNAGGGSTLGTLRCKTDLGLILEAFAEDLEYGGNAKTVEAFKFYLGSNGEILHIRLQLLQSLYAHERLGFYAKAAIDGTLTTVHSTAVVIPPAGITVDAGGCANVKSAIDTLVTLINSNLSPTGDRYADAGDLMLFNKNYIAIEAVGLMQEEFSYTNTGGSVVQTFEYPGGQNDGKSTCERDMKLIVDSIVSDLLVGGNFSTVEAAKQYLDTANSIVQVEDQLAQTSQAVENVGMLCKKAINNLLQSTGDGQISGHHYVSRFVNQTIYPAVRDETITDSQDDSISGEYTSQDCKNVQSAIDTLITTIIEILTPAGMPGRAAALQTLIGDEYFEEEIRASTEADWGPVWQTEEEGAFLKQVKDDAIYDLLSTPDLIATPYNVNNAEYTATTGNLVLTIPGHGMTPRTLHTVTDASYLPALGTMELTISGHGFVAGDKIKINNGSLTFKCNEDSYGSEHSYPRAGDPYADKWLPIYDITADTFKVFVGLSPNTSTHQFYQATVEGVQKQNSVIRIKENSLTFTCSMDDNTTYHSYPRVTDPYYKKDIAVDSVSSNTITVNIGTSPTVNYTPTGGTYDPATGDMVLTIGSYDVTGATYNPTSGDMELTIGANHGLTTNDTIRLKNESLTFSCTAGTGTHVFVSGTTGGLVFTLDSDGTEVLKTAASGTTYDPATGNLVLEIGSHTFTTNDTLEINDGAVTFTCDADSNGSNHAYPRADDPASGAILNIDAVSATTVTVDVGANTGTQASYPRLTGANTTNNRDYAWGKELPIDATSSTTITINVNGGQGAISVPLAHTFQTATSGAVMVNHYLHAGQSVKLAQESITFSCDTGSGAANGSYPRTTDPYYDTAINIKSVGTTTITPDNATYEPRSGELTLTVNSHGLTGGDLIKLDDGAVTFTCLLDGDKTTHVYPRPSDPASQEWLPVTVDDEDQFSVKIGPSPDITQHTFVSATPNGVKVQDGTITLNVGVATAAGQYAHTWVSATVGALITGGNYTHTFINAAEGAVEGPVSTANLNNTATLQNIRILPSPVHGETNADNIWPSGQRETFGAGGWTISGGTITGDATMGPDATMTADKYIPGNNTNPKVVERTYTLPVYDTFDKDGISFDDTNNKFDEGSSLSYQEYTWSCFVKQGEYYKFRHSISWSATDKAEFTWDAVTGAIGPSLFISGNVVVGDGLTSSSTFEESQARKNINWGVKPYGFGWFRPFITIRVPFGIAQLDIKEYMLNNTGTLSGTGSEGDGVKGSYIWGAKLSKGFLDIYQSENGFKFYTSDEYNIKKYIVDKLEDFVEQQLDNTLATGPDSGILPEYRTTLNHFYDTPDIMFRYRNTFELYRNQLKDDAFYDTVTGNIGITLPAVSYVTGGSRNVPVGLGNKLQGSDFFYGVGSDSYAEIEKITSNEAKVAKIFKRFSFKADQVTLGGGNADFALNEVIEVTGNSAITGTIYALSSDDNFRYMDVVITAGTFPLYNGITGQTSGAALAGGTNLVGSITNLTNAGADSNRTQGSYDAVAVTGGNGSNATFNVTVDDQGAANVTIANGGTGYGVSDVLTIPDANIGNGGGANITLEVGTLTNAGIQTTVDRFQIVDLTNDLGDGYSFQGYTSGATAEVVSFIKNEGAVIDNTGGKLTIDTESIVGSFEENSVVYPEATRIYLDVQKHPSILAEIGTGDKVVATGYTRLGVSLTSPYNLLDFTVGQYVYQANNNLSKIFQGAVGIITGWDDQNNYLYVSPIGDSAFANGQYIGQYPIGEDSVPTIYGQVATTVNQPITAYGTVTRIDEIGLIDRVYLSDVIGTFTGNDTVVSNDGYKAASQEKVDVIGRTSRWFVGFDGTQTQFKLTEQNGTPYFPDPEGHMMIFVNGILQPPGANGSYTAFSDIIQFNEAPTLGSSFTGFYVGKMRQLDDISFEFDSLRSSFNLKRDGTFYSIALTEGVQATESIIADNNIIISLNGVIQQPGIGFELVGSRVVFKEIPRVGSTFVGFAYIGSDADVTQSEVVPPIEAGDLLDIQGETIDREVAVIESSNTLVTFEYIGSVFGRDAAGEAVTLSNRLDGVQVTNPGSGYTSRPVVRVDSASGFDGAVKALVGISRVDTNAVGSGYKYPDVDIQNTVADDYTAPNPADYGEEAIYKEEIIDEDVVNVTPDNLSEVNSGDIPGHGPSPAGTGTNLTSFEITDIWSSTP